MKAGYTVTGTRNFQRPSAGLTRAAGATECVYDFGPGNAEPGALVRFVTEVAQEAWAQGARPWITFGVNFLDVTTGRWAAPIRTMCEQLADVGQGELVLMPGAYREASRGPASFAAGFNRFAETVRKHGDQAQTCWASRMQSWATADKAGRLGHGLLLEADVLALSVVPDPAEAGMIVPEFAGFRHWREATSLPTGAPWAIVERLFPAGASQRAAVLRELDWLLHHETGASCAAYLVGNPEGSVHGLDEAAGDAVLELLAAIQAGPPEVDKRYHFRPIGPGLVAHGWTGLVVAADQQDAFLRWLGETSPTLMADLGTPPKG